MPVQRTNLNLLASQPLNPSIFRWFGPFLIYFILCFSPLIEGGTTYYPVTIIQIILLIILVSGVFRFYQEAKSLSLESPPFYPILLFLTYSLIIAFLTPYKLPAFQQVELLFFYFILFYFSVLFNLTQNRFQEIVLNLLFVMGLSESIYGIGQFIFFHQRAKGTFFNPDFFGEYLAMISCVFLGRNFDGYKNKIYRWLNSGFFFILGTGIFLSQSRGAALAWVAGISFVLWRRFKIKVVYAWLTLFLLFSIIPNPLQYRFLHDYREDPYSLSRLEMWKEAIHMIRDHPMGIGIETYPFTSPQYVFPIDTGLKHYGKIAESPHNEYLRLFSEMGIIGGLFFLGSIAFFYLKWADKRDQSYIHAGIQGGTAIFFIHALVDSNFHEPALVITVIMLSTFLVDKKLFHVTEFRKIIGIKKIIFYPFSVALFVLLVVMAIKPAMGWHFYSNGYVQIKNNQENSAQLNYKKAIFWETQNARYHNALANGYFNTFQKTNYYGWVFKALEELNQALSLNPIDGNYFKLKGEIYQTLAVREQNPQRIQELLTDAFTNYREALKLLPYDVSLYLDLGLVEEASGMAEDAEIHYNQAVFIEPNYLIAREKKIELLLRLGKLEVARNSYQELISIHNSVQKLATSDADKAFIYFNQDKLAKAVEEAK